MVIHCHLKLMRYFGLKKIKVFYIKGTNNKNISLVYSQDGSQKPCEYALNDNDIHAIRTFSHNKAKEKLVNYTMCTIKR